MWTCRCFNIVISMILVLLMVSHIHATEHDPKLTGELRSAVLATVQDVKEELPVASMRTHLKSNQQGNGEPLESTSNSPTIKGKGYNTNHFIIIGTNFGLLSIAILIIVLHFKRSIQAAKEVAQKEASGCKQTE